MCWRLSKPVLIAPSASRDLDRAGRQLDAQLAAGPAPKKTPRKTPAPGPPRRSSSCANSPLRRPTPVCRGPGGRANRPDHQLRPPPSRISSCQDDLPRYAKQCALSKCQHRSAPALARWIADRRNPLTARVVVNHVWARHFGEPLASSTDDFGLRTPLPLHHALLDWLAVDFMEADWSFKHLHRLIVTSRAYAMESSATSAREPNVALDPDNRYLWRMNAGRMEGEVVRDSVLFLSGRLDSRMGGPDLTRGRCRNWHAANYLLPLQER